ncbi:hypothetical protein [Streptomyces sp. CoT10]|nr:hypothetical protein [Streptomyces sp. CoT10]
MFDAVDQLPVGLEVFVDDVAGDAVDLGAEAGHGPGADLVVVVA